MKRFLGIGLFAAMVGANVAQAYSINYASTGTANDNLISRFQVKRLDAAISVTANTVSVSASDSGSAAVDSTVLGYDGLKWTDGNISAYGLFATSSGLYTDIVDNKYAWKNLSYHTYAIEAGNFESSVFNYPDGQTHLDGSGIGNITVTDQSTIHDPSSFAILAIAIGGLFLGGWRLCVTEEESDV